MRIDGMWYLCDDGMIRPVISGEVLAGDGTWVSALSSWTPEPTEPF
jgi:hypothetical protein